MNIRNAQQAMRSFQDMNGFNAGDAAGLRKSDLVGPKLFLESEPTCPSGGTYVWAEGRIPKIGALVLRCSHVEHVPAEHDEW